MLEIEIFDVNIIDGGVEVFARAWATSDIVIKQFVQGIYEEQQIGEVVDLVKIGEKTVDIVIPAGSQIGFGKDGTVDIERFRIFNPPVLVPDSLGDVKRTSYDENTDTTTESLYREDPEEAILQAIEHIIHVKKEKFDEANIIIGKVGNTTTTVYPDAGTGSTTVDGRVLYSLSNSTWAQIHDETTSNLYATPSATNNICVFIDCDATTDRFFQMYRLATLFDTSAVGTDTVSSATYSLYPQATGFDTFTATQEVGVITSNPTSNNNLVGTDYAYTKWGTTDLATRKNVTAMTSGAYQDFTLNASGIAAIDGSGVTKLGLRLGCDIDDTSPWENNKEAGVNIYQADQTGTTNDPKLVIEHAAAATNEVKSVSGVSNV